MKREKKMKILLTGATGFVGRNLFHELKKNGHELRCLVRNEEKARKLFGDDACEMIVGNVTDKDSLKGITEGIDVVYHLAGLRGHDLPSPKAFARFRHVNVEGLRNIIKQCQGTKLKKFIYISSTAAMGLHSSYPVDEETPCKPITPYQVSKFEGEQLVWASTAAGDIPGVVIRPSRIYGPGFKGDFVTIGKLAKTGFFPRIGKGKNLSPALFIDDIVSLLATVKDRGKVGETYIVSSEEEYSLEDAATILASAIGVHTRLVYVPRFLAIAGAWCLEVLSRLLGRKPIITARNIRSATTKCLFDISKAKQELGFSQQIDLEEGLVKTVAYFQRAGYL